MRLAFVGPPGSGKGTQSKLLRERLGLPTIGTGDILRDTVRRGGELGQKVKPILESGQLVPDDLVNVIVADLFRSDDRPTNFVVDGYPRTLPQAEWFSGFLRSLGLDIQYAIQFAVSDDEVVRRLSGRLLTQGRNDDGEATVRKRLAIYHANMDRLIEHYRELGILREIDATADIETVYKTIVSLFQKS